MTDETALVVAIGERVAGPRHVTMLPADPEVVELVTAPVEQGMAASKGYLQRINGAQMIRVGLTGKGWVRYKEEREKP